MPIGGGSRPMGGGGGQSLRVSQGFSEKSSGKKQLRHIKLLPMGCP